MRRLTLRAPAKLNLFLHVVGRRADGYHLLQSIFQLIDLCDELVLAPRTDGRIVRHGGVPGLPAEADLTVRAARALADATGVTGGASITVAKHIPAGAGLGGGSSDAAAVLLGLNALWGAGLDTAALAAIGQTLGADVPVFVHGCNAWVAGIGEQVDPVALEPAWFAVCVPAAHVDTGAVFRHPDLVRDSSTVARDAALGNGQVLGIVQRGRNDCAQVSRRMHPAVDAVFEAWAGLPARLSGTGGAVFVPCDSQTEARAIAQRAPAGTRVFVCRGLDRSPAQDAILRASG